MGDKDLAGGRAGGGQGWLTRGRALALVLAAATAIVFYVCYLLARPFLPALAWALALAVVAHPLHGFLARRVKSENLSAALSVTLVAALIVAPTVFVTERLVSQALGGVQAVRAEVESGQLIAGLKANPRLAPVVSWVEKHVNLRDEAERLAAGLTSRVSSYVSGSVWAALELLITLFALFYFFRDRRKMLRGLRSLVPLSEREADEVFARVRDTIHATVYGTLAVSVAQGVLMGLMFWWLGLPAPLLWGVVMAVLSVVPVLGAFVVWIPAATYLALAGAWGEALVLAAWGTVVVGLIDNLLYPVLVGWRLRLHTLPVFISILGGLFLFGASGLILGPVTLALAAALLDVWRRRTSGLKRDDDEGVRAGAGL